MANYYSASRTNHVRVKDVTAFKAWAEARSVEVHESGKHPRHFAVFPSDDSDSGSFPSYDYENDTDIDFADELSKHLADDSVAVIMETGSEKLRYLVGFAIAINHRGERVDLRLDEIYERAKKKFGKVEITEAEY